MSETVLRGGDLNFVVRIGDTVRRPVGPWSPAVHALLQHFGSVGFNGAPRFLGIDDEGREILSYVEGDAAFAPVPAGDEVVSQIGRLLRRLHDAQAGFEPPVNAVWQRYPGEQTDGDVVCHNDLFWTNVIFRNGQPGALIDWDLATPGSRLADVGSAAAFWAPLRTDAEALEWGLPTERRGERLRLLCDGYGLERDERSRLLDIHLARRRLGLEAHRLWGGVERRPGWREMWDRGTGTLIAANLRWVEDHRTELDAWMR